MVKKVFGCFLLCIDFCGMSYAAYRAVQSDDMHTSSDVDSLLAGLFKEIVQDETKSVLDKCTDVECLIKRGFNVNKPFAVCCDPFEPYETPLQYLCNPGNIGSNACDYSSDIVALANMVCFYGANVNEGNTVTTGNGRGVVPLVNVLNFLSWNYFNASKRQKWDMKSLKDGCLLVAVLLQPRVGTGVDWDGLPFPGTMTKCSPCLKPLFEAIAVDVRCNQLYEEKYLAEVQQFLLSVMPKAVVDLINAYVVVKPEGWPVPFFPAVTALRDSFRSGKLVRREDLSRSQQCFSEFPSRKSRSGSDSDADSNDDLVSKNQVLKGPSSIKKSWCCFQ